MNIIIVEGVDGVGKTTVAKELAKELNYGYIKNPFPSRDYYNNYNTSLFEFSYLLMILKTGKLDNIVLDRWYSSELVYSYLYKREIEKKQFWKMDRELAEMGAVGLYLHKLQKKESYKNENVNYESLQILDQKYMKYIEKSKIPYHTVSTNTENVKDQIKLIKFFLKGAKK